MVVIRGRWAGDHWHALLGQLWPAPMSPSCKVYSAASDTSFLTTVSMDPPLLGRCVSFKSTADSGSTVFLIR